jgi:hypothetical protein
MTSAAKHKERSHKTYHNSAAAAKTFMTYGGVRHHGKIREIDPYRATGLTKKLNVFQRIINYIRSALGIRKQDRG